MSVRTIEAVNNAAWMALATNTTAARAGLVRVKAGANQGVGLWTGQQHSQAPDG